VDFHPITYIKGHPVIAGVIVFIVGYIALKYLGVFGSSSSGDGGASAYYSAVVADNATGAQVQLAQINADAQTAQTQIAADAYTGVQTTWAQTQLSEQTASNANSLALAPYAQNAGLIAGLTAIATQPPTVTTSKSNGFFGIGGGTSTKVTPAPGASSAADSLEELLHSFLGAQTG